MLGNMLRKGAELSDKASAAISTKAADLKTQVSALRGDEKDSAVFDSAIDLVRDALLECDKLDTEINNVLKKVKENNPYAK